MALEGVFRDLQIRIRHVEGAVSMLQKTVEDKPPDDPSALVDDLENIGLDLMGMLHDMRRTATLARRRVGHPVDLDGARQALTLCHERFHRMERNFSGRLMSYHELRGLARLATRGGEWPSWADRTKKDIEQCRPLLQEISKALAACWQELVEHSGKTSISIRTENLGQKVIANGIRETVGNSST